VPAQPQGPSSLGRLLLALPQRLSERAVIVAGAEVATEASWVLYWCHHAMRADENPALDAAGELALRLGKPLLVFGGLAGSHPHLCRFPSGPRRLRVARDGRSSRSTPRALFR